MFELSTCPYFLALYSLYIVLRLFSRGSQGVYIRKSVKTHHPSRVPDFAHGVLVRNTYIGKDWPLTGSLRLAIIIFVIYYRFKYKIYISFLVGDGCRGDVDACGASDAPLLCDSLLYVLLEPRLPHSYLGYYLFFSSYPYT